MRLTPVFLVLVLFSVAPASGQAVTSISSIREAPASFRDTVLTVEGYVTDHDTLAVGSRLLYYLKGTQGTTLQVRTAREAPQIGRRYAVTGPLVGVDREDSFLVEQARSRLSGPGAAGTPSAARAVDQSGAYRGLVYVLGGAIVLVLLGLVGMLVFVNRSDESAHAESSNVTTETAPDSGEDAADRVIENDTLKMHVPPEDGWTVLPGRLVVKSGLEEVSEIRFYTSDGQRASPLTFGRTEGAALEHVQLKTSSVSNWQAKVVYDADADRCTLVNYAVANTKPTRLNGRVLEESESVELSEGDTLEMGDIEFQFATG